MPTDPRTRYVVLQPITSLDGRVFWLRSGIAYRNPDGTIDGYLDAVVIGNRFWLRELEPHESAGASQDRVPS